jgi:hypothetical protein
LVSSSRSADAPRRRRVYRRTDAGEVALAAERREWRSFARAVELIQNAAAIGLAQWCVAPGSGQMFCCQLIARARTS